MLDALVFDFDGLILDTETSLYEAWRHTYEHHGLEPITLEEWSESLGLADDDPELLNPMTRLLDHLGGAADIVSINKVRREVRDDLLAAMTIQPGVEQLLDQAAALDIATAIASSSPFEWIESHLGPRGLLPRFEFLSCVDAKTPGKPHPATYLNACQQLGADPTRSLALEDSPNGARAAKAAGMFCIAVPAGVSAELDFSHADHSVPSLENVDLTELPFL